MLKSGILLLLTMFNCGVSFTQHNDDIELDSVLIVSDEWPQMMIIFEELKRIEKYHADTTSQENIDLGLNQYDAIFMYVHAVLIENVAEKLIEFTHNGGKLIVLHHGIASSKINNPNWLNFVGIELYPRDHNNYPWKVVHHTTHRMVNLAPGHFITSNNINYSEKQVFISDHGGSFSGTFDAFDLEDTEVFINQTFTDNHSKTILFGFVNDSIMQPTSGWYEKKGTGWLYYFQAGHAQSDYRNMNFMQVLLNALEF